MTEFLQRPLKYEALYKKYASKKFMKASVFVRDWMDKHLGSGSLDDVASGTGSA